MRLKAAQIADMMNTTLRARNQGLKVQSFIATAVNYQRTADRLAAEGDTEGAAHWTRLADVLQQTAAVTARTAGMWAEMTLRRREEQRAAR